jgi:hypothetical protein
VPLRRPARKPDQTFGSRRGETRDDLAGSRTLRISVNLRITIDLVPCSLVFAESVKILM